MQGRAVGIDQRCSASASASPVSRKRKSPAVNSVQSEASLTLSASSLPPCKICSLPLPSGYSSPASAVRISAPLSAASSARWRGQSAVSSAVGCHSGSSRVLTGGCAAPRGRCRCGQRGDGSAQGSQATTHPARPGHRAARPQPRRGRCRSGSTRRPDKAVRHRPARHPAHTRRYCRPRSAGAFLGLERYAERGTQLLPAGNAAPAAQKLDDKRGKHQQADGNRRGQVGKSDYSSYWPPSLRSSHSALVTSTARAWHPHRGR